MNYKILFYVGCVITAVTFISTIVAFFKCNVIEIVCDLLGIKLQKKVKIKRKGNRKSKAVSTTVKVKKKSDVKIRSLKEIEEQQNTKSYYVGPKKKKGERTGWLTGRITAKSECKDKAEATNMITHNPSDFVEDTGIMEVSETDVIKDATSIIDENTSIIVEDTSIVGEDTCIIDEQTSLLEEEDETGLLEEEDETGLLEEDDETSLLGMDEDDETCLLDEDINLEDGFAEKFTKELEIIVVNSDTII